MLWVETAHHQRSVPLEGAEDIPSPAKGLLWGGAGGHGGHAPVTPSATRDHTRKEARWGEGEGRDPEREWTSHPRKAQKGRLALSGVQVASQGQTASLLGVPGRQQAEKVNPPGLRPTHTNS